MSSQSTSEAQAQQIFVQYMLAELQMSDGHSRYLAEAFYRATQVYLGLVSVLFGGAATVLATSGTADYGLVIGVPATLAGVIGVWFVRIKCHYQSAVTMERLLRGGIHGYFRRYDPEAFREFGGELLVARHAFPSDSLKSPWALGWVDFVHSAMGAAGFGVLTYVATGWLEGAGMTLRWLPEAGLLALATVGSCTASAVVIVNAHKRARVVVQQYYSQLSVSRGSLATAAQPET